MHLNPERVLLCYWVIFYPSFISHSKVWARECTRSPIGLMQMSKGIDITELDLDDSKGTTSGFKKSLFDFTCNVEHNYSWTWAVPEQLSIIDKTPKNNFQVTTQVLRSFHDFKKRMARRSGLILTEGMFSRNSQYRAVSRELIEYSTVITEIRAIFNTVDVELNTSSLLGDHVQKRLSILPDNLHDNPEAYQDFIGMFVSFLTLTNYFRLFSGFFVLIFMGSICLNIKNWINDSKFSG
ncbi:perivitellin-2 67 kDa subunit-like [Convolutriloba macropyga]|uniref:perivitellin-2 67 kDa subunit-like n=1 Tax=Convolutriloba macropyga TaxID=536237 RepID=UPI003F528548